MNDFTNNSYNQPGNQAPNDSNDDTHQISEQLNTNIDLLRKATEELLQYLHEQEEMPGEISYQAGETHPDLYSVIEALTALRQEISLQGRSFHNLEKTLAQLVGNAEEGDAGEQNHTIIQRLGEIQSDVQKVLPLALQQIKNEEREKGKMSAMEELLEPLLDTHDQLRRLTIKKSEPAEKKPSLFRFFKRKSQEDHDMKTLELIYTKMGQRLNAINVLPVAQVGAPFQPKTMKAVDVKVTDQFPDSVVVEIYRQGYVYENEVLRFAEVLVSSSPSKQ